MEMGSKREKEDEFDELDNLQTGSFMELLGFGNALTEHQEEEEQGFIFPPSSLSSFPSSSSSSTMHMLCFGPLDDDDHHLLNVAPRISSDSSLTTLSSSSPSSTPTSKKPKTPRKANSGGGVVRSKRPRKEASGTARVRKEKVVAERIGALQQLLSLSCKIDTATILHEALEYIKFLQDRVQQVLSSQPQQQEGGDLRSRGLCVVPVSCTGSVADSVDSWSSPLMGISSTSGSKH